MKRLHVVLLVWGVLCCAGLCIAILVRLYGAGNRRNPRAFPDIVPKVGSTSDVGKPMILPMFYDKNGVYVVNVTVDGQAVTAVVDTGSAHLLVAGHNCESCLYTQQNGVILPKSNPKQRNDKLSYGSQLDTIDWYDGTIEIGGKRFESEYALVRKRVGSSSYNIMGVGRMDEQGPNPRPKFLSYLSSGGILTFEVRDGEGRLWLGGRAADHPQPQFEMPMLPAPFYRVALHSIQCGEEPVGKSLRPVDGVVFDTGSNMMDVPRPLYEQLKPGLEANRPLELVFGSNGFLCNGSLVRITFSSDQYRWNGKKLLVLPGSDPDQIVIGSLFMNFLRLTFDTERNVFGLSKLSK